MRDHRAPERAAVSVPGGEAWFISLGDLLTLLVCFFLVLTPQTPSNAKTRQDNQMVSSQGAGTRYVGTDLASHPLDRISSAVAVLPVWRDQLGLTDESGESMGHGKPWLEELRSALGRGERVVVKLCDRALEQQVVAEVAANNASDQGSATSLQFEVNAACGVFEERVGSSEQLAAVVMFAGK